MVSHMVKLIFEHQHAHMQDLYPFLTRFCIDLSHICHNRDCAEFTHLIWEPHLINLLRNYCKALKQCCGHFIGNIRLPDCIF
jgi:hypothetical protein